MKPTQEIWHILILTVLLTQLFFRGSSEKTERMGVFFKVRIVESGIKMLNIWLAKRLNIWYMSTKEPLSRRK